MRRTILALAVVAAIVASYGHRIADLSKVWVVAEVFEQEAAYLRPGGQARIAWKGQGRQLPARITDSLPQSEAGGGTVKLRLEADNPAFVLRPEMLVDVELPVRLQPAVTVPLDALSIPERERASMSSAAKASSSLARWRRDGVPPNGSRSGGGFGQVSVWSPRPPSWSTRKAG